MSTILTSGTDLVLEYEPRDNGDWVIDLTSEGETAPLLRTFFVDEVDLVDASEPDGITTSILVKIGQLEGEYWHLNSRVLDVPHQVYIHSSYSIRLMTLRNGNGDSVFREIFKVISTDLWIGGPHQDALPTETFDLLLARFPSKAEVRRYALTRTSSVLKEYFSDAVDFEAKYERLLQRRLARGPVRPGDRLAAERTLTTLFKASEHEKYTEILATLEVMLGADPQPSEEAWQKAILDILLLLYPKYVAVLGKVRIDDHSSGEDRVLDFLLVDGNGNTDIVEIKKATADLVTKTPYYRKNHVPMRELSGAVMQVEKYIFNMNKAGSAGEDKLNREQAAKLPPGLKIKITNPKGIVIMGRSAGLSEAQLADFEIIKRKYANVMDILSYDDLLERVRRILEKFS